MAPEEVPQCVGHRRSGVLGGDHRVDGRDRRVGLAGTLQMLHRYAGVGQRVGVGVALVAQRVELAGDHHRRRQARQVVGTQR